MVLGFLEADSFYRFCKSDHGRRYFGELDRRLRDLGTRLFPFMFFF